MQPKYIALFFAMLILFGTWVFFCITQPETVPVVDLINTIKSALSLAVAVWLALYERKPPTGGAS